MIIDVLTLFPENIESFINSSIIKRVIEKKIVTINVHNFRDYSINKHHKVDDTPYGGGAGMLITLQPIVDCLKSIKGYDKAYKIITTPAGKTYNQNVAKELSKKEHIIIICGHYEGIDERILNYVDEEISIGDYVLTGGEIASLAILDSVVRLLPNAISSLSIVDESFNDNLLEYAQYTKPASFDGYKVPDVLISGNHEEIRKYRRYSSLLKTYTKRPELLDNVNLSKEDLEMLKSIKNQ